MRHPFSRRDIVALSLLAVSCVFLFSTFALVQSAPQGKRSFLNKVPQHVPLKIKIKKEKEDKALDVNNKDWFKDLEIEVTNTSDKPIYFLSLNVEMPDLPTQNSGAIKVFPLRYGRADFFEPNTKPLPDDVPIQPKATYTFVVDEKNRTGYQEWRTKDNRNDPLKLEISINFLSFGDGTGFTSMSAVPFPVKNSPEEVGPCLQKTRPPDEWAKMPNCSLLYRQDSSIHRHPSCRLIFFRKVMAPWKRPCPRRLHPTSAARAPLVPSIKSLDIIVYVHLMFRQHKQLLVPI